MSLSDPDLFYLSADDYAGTENNEGVAVGGSTTVPTLVDQLTSDQVKSLLLETMVRIDGFVGSGWTPFTDGQEFIFPRCRDTDSSGNAMIPRPIALATRMIADAILTKRQKGLLPHEVANESNLGHSYTKRSRTIEADFGFEDFPPEAIAILQKYRNFGGQLAVTDPWLEQWDNGRIR